jgi:DNA-binding response OmpR family regulator
MCRKSYKCGMLYFAARMPIVFVIASDWTLRTSVRAELREIGVEALGMETPEEVGRALAAGELPSVVVLEATEPAASAPAVQRLVERIPTVLVASRTETVAMPCVAAVFYRPVRIGEIVARVRELLQQAHSA